MKTNTHFRSYLAPVFLELKIFQIKLVEKIKTHFMFINIFFFENLPVYEITWKNFVELDRR